MSRICALCGKTSQKAYVLVKLRGKYNPTVKKKKHPNLQWVTLDGERVKACARCIKQHNKK